MISMQSSTEDELKRCFRSLKGVPNLHQHVAQGIANRYRDRASVYFVEQGQASSEAGTQDVVFSIERR